MGSRARHCQTRPLRSVDDLRFPALPALAPTLCTRTASSAQQPRFLKAWDATMGRGDVTLCGPVLDT